MSMKITALAVMALTCVANAQLFNEFGPDAGNGTMTGWGNTGNGADALLRNMDGRANTANGYWALMNNTNGSWNVAIGGGALASNTAGNNNCAVGSSSLYLHASGNRNVAIGDSALLRIMVGDDNIAMGSGAGQNLSEGFNNIYIGNNGVDVEVNTIRIGTPGSHTTTFIAGIAGVTVPNAANPVVVDSVSGQLGTVDISSLKGVGFVTGAYLYLPVTTASPDGFTKIGSKTDFITDLHGQIKVLKMNVYQKK